MLPKFPETVGSLLTETAGADGTSRLVTGEIRGLSDRAIASSLDLWLRTITAQAALTDAVLETRAAKCDSPRVMSCDLVVGIARGLWEAGFSVTFGTSWEPVCDTDLAVGTGGSDGELEDFIREGGSWEITPRRP